MVACRLRFPDTGGLLDAVHLTDLEPDEWASSRMGLAEEQPAAYKNVDHVVDVVHEPNLSRKVARMRPIGVIKG